MPGPQRGRWLSAWTGDCIGWERAGWATQGLVCCPQEQPLVDGKEVMEMREEGARVISLALGKA